MFKGLAITCVCRLLPLIGTGRLSGSKTSTLQSPNKSGAWSQSTGREHELSQSWNCLEARIGRVACLNSMTGKVFQEDRRRQAW
jgi:hypothetical protein